MKPLAEVVQFFFADLFYIVYFFFYPMNRFRLYFFDFFRKPVTFNQIKSYYADHHDKKQRNTDLLKIADNADYRAAKEITDTR